eukprot:TRINITY_DN2184_c0_g1_i1.p1 TRINITY_DN2184_c0_g1~~TRINITY_DN2184_c0_g1_i1.p1  ORF type:complete len:324 (+),score=132.66 TRINITY_DN2184_c0_g1_i1:101-1072(+)
MGIVGSKKKKQNGLVVSKNSNFSSNVSTNNVSSINNNNNNNGNDNNNNNNSNNNNNNNNDNDIMDLVSSEEDDDLEIKEELKELYKNFEKICLLIKEEEDSLLMNQLVVVSLEEEDKDIIKNVLEYLYELYLKNPLDEGNDDKDDNGETEESSDECPICFEEYTVKINENEKEIEEIEEKEEKEEEEDDDKENNNNINIDENLKAKDEDEVIPIAIHGCKVGCNRCYREYIDLKIKEKKVFPWIRCPNQHCNRVITPDDLLILEDYKTVLKFNLILMNNLLLQENKHWIPCQGDKCDFGFLFFSSETEDPVVQDILNKKKTKM